VNIVSNEQLTSEEQTNTQPSERAAADASPSSTHVSTQNVSQPRIKPATDIESLRRQEQAGNLVMQARSALRKGKRDEAKELLKQAFALHPTDTGAFETLADIFFEEGEQQKAIQVLERGLKYHPTHKAFEERLALAHLDLAEMERDRILREQFMQKGEADLSEGKKPNHAALLSFLLPGAGQFYNEEMERAGVFLLASLITFCAWFIPFRGAYNKPWAWLLVFVWLGVHAFASWDAAQGVKRANSERRRVLGLE
jgi:tetratricopeptide (TPR) repeat protein